MLKVLLVGGGTAGHINPAIAIANDLVAREKQIDILFAGTPTGMEKKLVEKSGYSFIPIQVSGFNRKLSPKGIMQNTRAVSQMIHAYFTAKKILKQHKPHVVIGTGGYVSGPVVRAAAMLGIKTMIHEQNAFPGITNKLLARQVDCVLLAVEQAKPYFSPQAYCQVVGNPVREEIILQSKKQARQQLGIGDQICVLSFGGSLGARAINRAAADLIAWNQQHQKIFHIHGYGRLGKQEFPQMLEKRNLSLDKLRKQGEHSIILREYLESMALYLAASDLVICRAGAMTISELQACGKPAILIPSPYVAENHQYHNAMVLKNHGAAQVIQEKEYNTKTFLKLVEEMVLNETTLREYGKKTSQLAVLHTTERIYHHMKTLLG